MDTTKINKLVQLMDKHDLQLIEVEENGVRIKLAKHGAHHKHERELPLTSANTEQKPETSAKKSASAQNGHEIKSPLVGVFFASATPDAEPFVKIGTKVRKGDIICIIEAMKQMNEIVADTDGEITNIYATNGDIVEYDQPLFCIV